MVVEKYAKGIPRLAALHDSNEAFSIWRKFGPYAARVLLHRELELNALVKKLDKMDKDDEADNRFRLHTVEYEESDGLDQIELIQKLEEKLSSYCENRHCEGRLDSR